MSARKHFNLTAAILLWSGAWLGKPTLSWGFTLQGGVLKEDFSETSHWDAAHSTGFWNRVNQAVEAARVTGGVASQKIDFGDGSDGDLTTDQGYVFDTNQHPNGYNFISVQITGGNLKVVGSNPLIIRSLSNLILTPTLSVAGAIGSGGVSGGVSAGSSFGSSGGQAVASLCAGGKGGNSAGTPAGDGSDGFQYDGTHEIGNKGTGGTGGTAGANASSAFDTADDPTTFAWETLTTPPHFRCGAGGAGGGGHVNGGFFSTAGSGGAGGGLLKLIAAGTISYGILNAAGGNGGQGVNDGSQCSGGGAGGNGGAIWLQSLKTINGTGLLVNAGQNGACSSFSGSGLAGFTRTDSATSSSAGAYTTLNVAASSTYQIKSYSYDLGTRDAGFHSQPTLATTLNGGSISVTYSGSSDGLHFTTPTSDLTSLNDQNVRYLNFTISIQTATVVGPSPQLNSISIPFEELDLRFNGGCAALNAFNNNSKKNFKPTVKYDLDAAGALPWALFFMAAYVLLRTKKRQKPLNILQRRRP